MVGVAAVSGWALALLLGGFRRWLHRLRGVGVWGGRERAPLVRFALCLGGAPVALGLCLAGLSGLRALLYVVFGRGASAVPPAWALARAGVGFPRGCGWVVLFGVMALCVRSCGCGYAAVLLLAACCVHCWRALPLPGLSQ